MSNSISVLVVHDVTSNGSLISWRPVASKIVILVPSFRLLNSSDGFGSPCSILSDDIVNDLKSAEIRAFLTVMSSVRVELVLAPFFAITCIRCATFPRAVAGLILKIPEAFVLPG